jgi:hypothetical protein
MMDELQEKMVEEGFRKTRHYLDVLDFIFVELEHNLNDIKPAMQKFYCAKDHLAKLRRYVEKAESYSK